MSGTLKHSEQNSEQSAPLATIMVVDDEPQIRELCKRALRDYQVFQAASCCNALELLEKERFDLVLTDVKLPGDTGLKLLGRIKERDPNAIVIVMTGYPDRDVVLTALKEGADDFLVKPFDKLHLRTAICRTLARKQLRSELADLKKLDQLKTHFLSIISHKLRTPLTTMSLYLQDMDEQLGDSDVSCLRKTLRLLKDETTHLGGLVNDLLLFSQVMVGKIVLNREPCDLREIVRQLLHKSAEAQRKPGIRTTLSWKKLPELNLDREKISFALLQLIDNAFKFSGDTGSVTVTSALVNDTVQVIISDGGIGIPEKVLSQVTEKFYQVDPDATGQVRGFGLGLYYASEFVRQHGGSLRIESRLGKGTTVTVTLPLQ